MAEPRGIGAHAPDPLEPGRIGLERGPEVIGMGAVDHVIGGGPGGHHVGLLERFAQRGAVGQPAVGFGRVGQNHRHLGGRCRADDPDALVDGADRDRGHEVGRGLGEPPDLFGVKGLGLVRRHRGVGLVAVAARADITRDDDRGHGPRVAPDLGQQRDGSLVQPFEIGRPVAQFRTPVPAGPPGRRFQQETTVMIGRDGKVPFEIGAQRPAPLDGVEQRVGGETRQVQPIEEDKRRLEAGIGEQRRAVGLRQAIAMKGKHYNHPRTEEI